MVKTVTLKEADRFIARYGLSVMWGMGSQRASNGCHQAIVCDYSKLGGYSVKYAIEVLDLAGRQVARFNVMR